MNSFFILACLCWDDLFFFLCILTLFLSFLFDFGLGCGCIFDFGLCFNTIGLYIYFVAADNEDGLVAFILFKQFNPIL